MKDTRRYIPVLGAPLGIITLTTYFLISDTPFLYHSPLGLYLVAGYLSTISFIVYWVFYFLLNKDKNIGFLRILFSNYFYTIACGVIVEYLEFNPFSLRAFIMYILLGILFNLINLKTRLYPVSSALRKIIIIFIVLFGFVIPIIVAIFIRYTKPEPLTPFQIRNESMSCSNDNDCSNFDCTGYNIGAFYCDTNGYPRCDLEKKSCSCRLSGCL